MDLKTNIDLSIDKGIVNINKFNMKGGEASAVRSVSFLGMMDLKNQIDVKTK